MEWIRSGTAWVYGDHIVGDDVIGGPELVNKDIYDPQILAEQLMQDIDPDFAENAQAGDFLVAGRNLGYSKAHQQFYLALQGFGIGGVIAESFQPFLRRAFPTYSIPFLRCRGITDRVSRGDRITVDFRAGIIENETTGETIQAEPMPEVLVPVYEAGGQLAYLKQKLDQPG